MNASKTTLAVAAFGVVAAFAPAQAEETRYNFSSEFSKSEADLYADGRIENVRRGYVAAAKTGPETGKFVLRDSGAAVDGPIVRWFHNTFINPPKHTDATRPFGRAWRTKDLSILRNYDINDYDRDGRLIANRDRNNSSRINDRQYRHNSFRPR